MRAIFISSAVACAALANPILSRAADQDVAHRFYGGTSLGATKFEDGDGKGSSFKLYGGYQFTENFGAEIGYLRTGDFRPSYSLAGQAITELAKTRALYTAGTARWQFSDSFSVTGLLGVARTQFESGSIDEQNNSLMVGIGMQFRLTPRIDLTMNVDHLGNVAEKHSADVATAGIVFRF